MVLQLDMRISVNSWNVIKFVLFQLLISLCFARLWEAFVRNRTYRIVYNGGIAKLFTSGIGRLSPAQVMVSRSRRTVNSKLILLVVNVSLLISLLLVEYGSISTPVFHDANTTKISCHNNLVSELLGKKRNVSGLYPMKLSLGEYKYHASRSRILLNVRVRNSTSNSFLPTKSTPQSVVKLCGMLSPSCESSFANAKLGKLSGVFEVKAGQTLQELFLSRNAELADYNISTSIRQVGWIDSDKNEFISLLKAKVLENISCIFRAHENSTRPLLHCALERGEYLNFFVFREPKNNVYEIFYSAQPMLKNRTDVQYSISALYEHSVFGVEKRFVPSTTVALLQILHYPNILRSFTGTDSTLLQVLKEQNVWALLGMVSGNSAIEQVILKTTGVNAAVNEQFIIGFCMILLICLILLAFNCAERCRGKPKLNLPVADAELLRYIREIENIGKENGEKRLHSPPLCKRRCGSN